MKKVKIWFGGLLASIALMVTCVNVNTACCFHLYQARLPEKAEQFRKF
jgi:AgrD protein